MQADERMPGVANNRFPISSLFAAVTLIAVWMAVPRRIAEGTEPWVYLSFVILHQLIFWLTIAALTSMLSGNRRLIRYLSFSSATLFVLPMIMLLVDTTVIHSPNFQLFNSVLPLAAIREPYVWTMTEIFGYDF